MEKEDEKKILLLGVVAGIGLLGSKLYALTETETPTISTQALQNKLEQAKKVWRQTGTKIWTETNEIIDKAKVTSPFNIYIKAPILKDPTYKERFIGDNKR